MAQINVEFELLKHIYMLSPVKVMVLKTVPSIPVLGSSLQKGSEEKMPRFIAEVLEKLGYVEILEKAPSPQDLTKMRFAHTQQRSTLVKLDDFFYIIVRDTITKLEEKAKKDIDITLIKIVDRAKEDFNEIFNLRLAVILRALQFGNLESVVKSLSIEEKTMAVGIQKLLESWTRQFLISK